MARATAAPRSRPSRRHHVEKRAWTANRDVLSRWFARTRFAATLLGAFAVVAFFLCAAGVFAVISLYVRARRRELAIRKAVGASERDLIRLVLEKTVRLTALGLAIGCGVSFALARTVSDLLYGVTPMDPATTAAAAVMLMAAALTASYLPARTLRSVHPAEALKSD